MTRTAKIYARLQSQKSGSARHIRYLLNGHGTDSTEVEYWTKGIPKKLATPKDLPKAWGEIDRQWRRERDTGGSVAKKSKVTYMHCLVALPNDISMLERHSLSKQLLGLFPQKHPATVVFHSKGASGLQNMHLHVAFSYRRYGYEKVDRDFQQGFEKDLKALLRRQYVKYGFKIEENKEEYQVKHKPQKLMRMLLKTHGVDRMKNPHFLNFVVLPDLKKEVEKCQQRCSQSNSDADMAYLQAAKKSVVWLSLEIIKAQSLKDPSLAKSRRSYDTEEFDDFMQPKMAGFTHPQRRERAL